MSHQPDPYYREVAQGALARRAGALISDSPYYLYVESNHNRRAWERGWLYEDEKFRIKQKRMASSK